MTARRSKLLPIVVGVWFVGVSAAFAAIWAYKATPGAGASAPTHWPAASTIRPAPGIANVVVFAHPQCPCTRATMTELHRLATLIASRAQIHVVLVEPEGAPTGFTDGAILARARALPGAEVVIDRGEREATRFAARTSGTTLVYAADGELLFAGGLTVARGHEGGPAAERIRDAIATRGAQQTSPIFGCALTEVATRSAR